MLAVILWAAVCICSVSSLDYCSTPCKRHGTLIQHTMCAFPSDFPPGRACVDFLAAELSADEREVVLSAHNKHRSHVAMGLETRGLPGPQPPAADMRQMRWDNEVAAIARRWARQCVFRHDQCRDTYDGVYVGQNLAISYSSAREHSGDLADLIKGFYDEVKFMPRDLVYSFQTTNFIAIGHYTQLVWATTHRIGCSRVRFTSAQQSNELLVCNYATGGNYLSQPMYQVGAACSNCPANWTCSSEYEGLCHSMGHTVTAGLVTWLILLGHVLMSAHPGG